MGKGKTIDNMEKYNTYKNSYEKLELAIENEFYFEACLITYAIIEDRLSSIIKYNGLKSDRLSMYEKSNIIRNLISNKSNGMENIFDIEEFKNIDNWRRHRNDVVHALMDSTYDIEEYKRIALDGRKYAKYLSACCTKIKNRKISEIRRENMSNYNLYKDIDNNFYISDKESALRVIKLAKEDEKYFDKRRARSLKEDLESVVVDLDDKFFKILRL